MNVDALIAAYEAELAAYRRRGLKDRAKLVEEELRRLGRSTGVTPREDVPPEPASTTPDTPDAEPKRPITRKKR